MTPLFQTLILLCSVVNGLKMPGSCPITPKTHIISYDFAHEIQVVFGAPFSSQHPSHLFKEINTTHTTNAGIEIEHEDTDGTYNLKDINIKNVIMSTSVATLDESKKFFNLNTTVNKLGKPLKCHKQTNEQVKIWYDDCFLIIWSCVENSESEHEEALLLGAASDNYNGITTCNLTTYRKLRNLQTMTQKYLDDTWSDKIIWSIELFNKDKIFYNVFDCMVFKFGELIIPGVVFLLFMSCVGAVLWGNCNLCDCNSNQVYPYVN